MTVEPDLTHAPGCFASALMCKPETAECSSCPFVERCGPLATAAREALHAKFGIKPKVPKAKKVKVDKPSTAIVSSQAQALVERIERAGLAVASSLRAGVNPFNKPADLKVACHVLMKRPGGITDDQLVACFMHKLAWERPRAEAQALVIAEALTALGAATFIDRRLTLRT